MCTEFLIVTWFWPHYCQCRGEGRETDRTSFVQLCVYKDIKSNEETKNINNEFSCSWFNFCEIYAYHNIFSCSKIQCDNQANIRISEDYLFVQDEISISGACAAFDFVSNKVNTVQSDFGKCKTCTPL